MEQNKELSICALHTTEENEILLRLLESLKSFGEDPRIFIWNEAPIEKSNIWKPDYTTRYEKADVVLVLLSNSFMYSEFVKQLEFKQLIDRHKAQKTIVLPILVENCPWDVDFEADEYKFSFKELPVLPEERKPIKSWGTLNEAFDSLTVSIGKVIDSFGLPDSGEENAKSDDTDILTDIADTPTSEIIDSDDDFKMNMVLDESTTQEIEAFDTRSKDDEDITEEPIKSPVQRRKKLAGMVVVAGILLLGFFLFFNKGDSKDEETPLIHESQKTVVVSDDKEKLEGNIPKKTAASTLNAGASLTVLKVGDRYKGGVVFEVTNTGRAGKFAHTENLGPMPWSDAIAIHEQLGEGWRLPTFEELKSMYRTIGQGATNSGQFQDELYWSATPFDDNQAKLVRFTDGNSSYHYNSRGTHRKFLVRAIQDFNLE